MKWYIKRQPHHAPDYFKGITPDLNVTTHAQAWAEGYNACVQRYIDELNERLRQETGS